VCFLGGELLLEPRLSHGEHQRRLRARAHEAALEPVLEVVEHRSRVGSVRDELRRGRAQRADFGEALAGALALIHRLHEAAFRRRRDAAQRGLLRRPAERALGMLREHLTRGDGGLVDLRGRALLHPRDDVAAADEEDDRV